MKEFEKFLKQNKTKLDLDELNPEIWLNIENQVLRRKNKRNKIIIRWLGIAATAAALLWGGLFFWYDSDQGPAMSTENLLVQYNLEKYQYPKLIYAKTNELSQAKIPQSSVADFKILIDQLTFLDRQYQEYLLFIEKNGYQKFIGKQLANYYEAKIELLDKIQYEIEKIKSYESGEDSEMEMVHLRL